MLFNGFCSSVEWYCTHLFYFVCLNNRIYHNDLFHYIKAIKHCFFIFCRRHPEIYNLGVQGINRATLMSADGLVCPPWEVLLTTVLGGIGAPVPIVYETELYGLVVRNHSAGRILMSRLTGVEGITRCLSSLKLKE